MQQDKHTERLSPSGHEAGGTEIAMVSGEIGTSVTAHWVTDSPDFLEPHNSLLRGSSDKQSLIPLWGELQGKRRACPQVPQHRQSP